MATMLSSLLLVLCCIARLRLSFSDSGQANSFESVPDLEKSMYMHIDGYPCVRLLNLSGEIGCSNPSREKVVAPIVRYKSADELLVSAAVLVSIDDFESLLSRLSKDSDFAGKVAGVLVESRTEDFLQMESFHKPEFAPYQSNNFEWNPTGSGIMWKAYNFPVFLLSKTSTSILQEVVMKNEKTKKSNTENVAEFNVVMQTTKFGTRDSDSCLKEETCLPLGGYR
ncbi:Nicastrin [Forsythia ovata]|uniref:Nicastrin n=1 Tax=Forsythia ovata TaxID=205694 RepID=A0ABD1UA48_9LAMI